MTPEHTKLEPYDARRHAASSTDEYAYSQLIPYIGSKRKLLDLIQQALKRCDLNSDAVFVDLFAGSGVVSRLAKMLGYKVIANDWEPYARCINGCYIGQNNPPELASFGGYVSTIKLLNELPGRVDWVTEHLCPLSDDDYDVSRDRLFYMRKNGMRIDAIRSQIEEWLQGGAIDRAESGCLIAPLLYEACYRSNTSGVFKGFHSGWGGKTGTALYRIATDLHLRPSVFHDNGKLNEVVCADACKVARSLASRKVDVVYIDPPYNQHPYGSNYHVLNSIALWDKPSLSKRITTGTKAAIRLDWRTERRSAYNSRSDASGEYRSLLGEIRSRYVLTSYSTDGTIPLRELIEANVALGHVSLDMKVYKRYRVSAQRYSKKPVNVEFVLILDTERASSAGVDELMGLVQAREAEALAGYAKLNSDSVTADRA